MWWRLPAWLAGVLLACVLTAAAPAQAEDTVPERTAEVVGALVAAQWQELETGFSYISVSIKGGPSLTAFRFSPDRFDFAVAVQEKPKGERVDAFGEREGAVAAVNGGFFGAAEKDGSLFPVGLLRRQGKDLSQPWSRAGGFLALSPGRVAIVPSGQGAPEDAADIIQSKPVLIEPGGRWAMHSNQERLRKRTIVCLTGQDDVILVVVGWPGLSLYEAGWLMRGPDVGGYFACDAALGLDGGGSTQIWVAGNEALSLRGETPVHNALIARRRTER